MVPDEFETRLKFVRFGLPFTQEPRNRMNLSPPLQDKFACKQVKLIFQRDNVDGLWYSFTFSVTNTGCIKKPANAIICIILLLKACFIRQILVASNAIY